MFRSNVETLSAIKIRPKQRIRGLDLNGLAQHRQFFIGPRGQTCPNVRILLLNIIAILNTETIVYGSIIIVKSVQLYHSLHNFNFSKMVRSDMNKVSFLNWINWENFGKNTIFSEKLTKTYFFTFSGEISKIKKNQFCRAKNFQKTYSLRILNF